MRIQTEREREPTLRNIERDAPETKVDTEVFENTYGVKTARETGIQTQDTEDEDADADDTSPDVPFIKEDAAEGVTESDTDVDSNSGSDSGSGGTERTAKVSDRKGKMPSADQLKRKKYTIASPDSDGSDVIEELQAIAGVADAVIQTGGTIRTAVRTSSDGIGKIHTMVKQGVRVGSVRDVGAVAATIGSGIKTGMVDAAHDAKNQLLKTKIDKSTTTDTGTESMKQGLTELRHVDNARKAVQNTARDSIRAVNAVRTMPQETREQIQRMRREAQLAREAVRKTADGVRKVLSSKEGIIACAAVLCVLIVVVLVNGLISVVLTSVTSTTGWMCPDGGSSDAEIALNMHESIEKIHEIRNKKQAEVDAVKNSLEPEYRYDGSVITGLNKFGESEIKLEDDKKVLALMATLKFRDLSCKNTNDLHFSDADVENALKCFYDFNHMTIKGQCPHHDCQQITGNWQSLFYNHFKISEDYVDSTTGKHVVILEGSTYEYASKYTAHLHIGTKLGGEFTGDYNALVINGKWMMKINFHELSYKLINWDKFELISDVTYCDNPNHVYLLGSVKNLTEEEALKKAGLTADERKIYQNNLALIEEKGV